MLFCVQSVDDVLVLVALFRNMGGLKYFCYFLQTLI